MFCTIIEHAFELLHSSQSVMTHCNTDGLELLNWIDYGTHLD